MNEFGGKKLSRSFYARPTLKVARELLGQRLVRNVDGERLSGIIVETEAYLGLLDPASHARFGSGSKAAPMFGEPGFAYIYFTYGMYYCLNTVTEPTGSGTAVLIRALEPQGGIDQMRINRLRLRPDRQIPDSQLTNGPGKLCIALGLDTNLNRTDLCGGELWIEKSGPVPSIKIKTSPRVGIRKDREQPWRFYLSDNSHVSKHPVY